MGKKQQSDNGKATGVVVDREKAENAELQEDKRDLRVFLHVGMRIARRGGKRASSEQIAS